ncbi:hypothetical protein O3884_00960 [Gemella sp. 20925_1_85]|uniref:hypothetical protein n=1 Tax=Gemella sp. 20925_1_85 TaxID=3003690 RepID=UPI00206B7844|nr:MAG TPA: hypothetical protein [Caudoviricetes sp.]
MFNDSYHEMNDFEKFVYLSDIFEPYIVDKIKDGKLVCEFKKDAPLMARKAKDMFEKLINSPGFELPR